MHLNSIKSFFFTNVKSSDLILKKGEKVYFPGLNGLRAISAISVIISHTFQERHNFELTRHGALSVGGYAVTAFFTLSGFLITYLLLAEKNSYNKINIVEFYIRRIFRIWPLYYFYIIITIFFTTIIFGYFDAHISSLWLFVLFIPNIAFNLNIYPAFLGHLWSIGIEEQF